MSKGVYIRKPITEETRKILSDSHKGKVPWNKGNVKSLPHCPVCGISLGDSRSKCCRLHAKLGRKVGTKTSVETRLKMSSMRQKENNSNWKGGKIFNIEKWRDKRRFWCLRRVALKKNAEGTHSYKEWLDLKKEYGSICPSCGGREPEISLTEDHIVPLSKGGSDWIYNIQPLCMPCNSKKHTKIIKYQNWAAK